MIVLLLEVFGVALFCVGLFLWSVSVGLVAVGIFVVLLAQAIERSKKVG